MNDLITEDMFENYLDGTYIDEKQTDITETRQPSNRFTRCSLNNKFMQSYMDIDVVDSKTKVKTSITRRVSKVDKVFYYLSVKGFPVESATDLVEIKNKSGEVVSIVPKVHRLIKKSDMVPSVIAKDTKVSVNTVKQIIKFLECINYIRYYDDIYNDISFNINDVSVLILTETIQFLLDATNDDVIKAYSYLYFRSNNKNNRYNDSGCFEFSYIHLAEVLGYTVSTDAKGYKKISPTIATKMKNILKVLDKCGLVKVECVSRSVVLSDGSRVTKPIIILSNVSDKVAE